MKALLVATDYTKISENDIKVLEINTNATIFKNAAILLDWNNLKNFIIDNKFKNVQLITPTFNIEFSSILQKICEDELKIKYLLHYTPENTLVPPNIDDNSDTFILRISYDTTAIIDEEYAKDNFSFLNAIKDLDIKPKTYIPNLLDELSNIKMVLYNKDNANFLLKKRFPNYSIDTYPKPYIVKDLKELNDIKKLVRADEFLQQITNTNTIRGINIIYGSELNIISMGGFEVLKPKDIINKISNKEKEKIINLFPYIIDSIKNDIQK
jgi:hypothetical protein